MAINTNCNTKTLMVLVRFRIRTPSTQRAAKNNHSRRHQNTAYLTPKHQIRDGWRQQQVGNEKESKTQISIGNEYDPQHQNTNRAGLVQNKSTKHIKEQQKSHSGKHQNTTYLKLT